MIIIMGSVGSGKSEQTARLTQRLNIGSISTSSLLKQNLTPVREALMRAGELINDKEIIELLEPEINKYKKAGEEFILDGFPRSIPQAYWLVKKIKAGEINLKAIIKLSVSDRVVLDRMLARGREDDKEEVIIHRLDAYHKITNPVVSFLREQGIKVHEVDGEVSPDQVEAEIKKMLDSKG